MGAPAPALGVVRNVMFVLANPALAYAKKPSIIAPKAARISPGPTANPSTLTKRRNGELDEMYEYPSSGCHAIHPSANHPPARRTRRPPRPTPPRTPLIRHDPAAPRTNMAPIIPAPAGTTLSTACARSQCHALPPAPEYPKVGPMKGARPPHALTKMARNATSPAIAG